ncbi:MAG: metallophosphoesterase family protein [candidate division FCPU426 bacterium]
MRLGVISDTHIPMNASVLPPEINTVFKNVDRILHAGDIESESVLIELESIAPVTAVAGNMDVQLHQLPHKREFRVGDYWIGLIHGAGVPRNCIREAIRREFNKANIIVYGHTHQAYWDKESSVWFMNPGSATDLKIAGYRSVGILEIGNGTLRGEIIRL